MKFLSLDFETSGVDPAIHAPVTLGIAVMDDMEVLDSREWLCSPPVHWKDADKITRAYDERARLIHGYHLETLILKGQPMAEVCAELTVFVNDHKVGNHPIVAWNANFDWSFFNTLLFLGGSFDRVAKVYRPYRSMLSGPWQCAMQLAQRRLDSKEDYKLDTIAEAYGLSRSTDKHGALEDCILAGKVFIELRSI